MKESVALILLGLMAWFPAPATAQSGLLPIPILTNVQVDATVWFDWASGRYRYAYTVKNPVSNTGVIDSIQVDIASPTTIHQGEDELVIPFGIQTFTFKEMLRIGLLDPLWMVPVGIEVPSGWHGSIGARGFAAFN